MLGHLLLGCGCCVNPVNNLLLSSIAFSPLPPFAKHFFFAQKLFAIKYEAVEANEKAKRRGVRRVLCGRRAATKRVVSCRGVVVCDLLQLSPVFLEDLEELDILDIAAAPSQLNNI